MICDAVSKALTWAWGSIGKFKAGTGSGGQVPVSEKGNAMSLLGRVIGTEVDEDNPKVPIHQAVALFAEYGRDPWSETAAVRRQRLIDKFQVQPTEEAELDDMIANMDDAIASIGGALQMAGVAAPVATLIAINMFCHEVHDVLVLGELSTYTHAEALDRLTTE